MSVEGVTAVLTFPLSVSIAGDKELLFAEEMEVVLWERTVDTLLARILGCVVLALELATFVEPSLCICSHVSYT